MMSVHYHDIFYSTKNLSLDDKIKICEWSKERSKKWLVDKLDCSVSFSRQLIEMSWEEIMKKLKNNSHFVIIHRRGFDGKKEEDLYLGEWCLEVGFRTMDSAIDHFLWIYCDQKYVDEIVKEFKLDELR